MSKICLSVVALCLIAVMVKLGYWQLDRADYKSQQQSKFELRQQNDVKALPDSLVNEDEWSYYQIKVKGYFQADQSFFVDNIVHQSISGVFVMTPFLIENSKSVILVNRGWIQWGNDRTFLPDIDSPQQTIELTGLLVPGLSGQFYLNDPENSNERAQLWSQMDLKRYIDRTDASVHPLILILDKNQPGSYQRIWQAQTDIWIARHKAYAVQWFGLALTLLIITVILNVKSYLKQEKT